MNAQPSPLSPEVLLSHADWVRALAGRLVADAARADDVAQEALAEAFARPPRDGVNPRGWLATVVRNTARRLGRGEARRARRERVAARDEAVSGPDELVQRASLQRELVGHVLELDEPYRVVVLMRYFDDLEASTIAAGLELPVETVRTRLKRAHERLRAKLDSEYGDRSSWCAALVLLARPSASAKAAVPASVATTLGGWFMLVGWKLAAVLGVVALGVLVWRSGAYDERIVSAGPATERIGVSPHLTETGSESRIVAGQGANSRSVVVTRSSSDSATAHVTDLGSVRVQGRVVDCTGTPLTGMRVRGRDESLPYIADGWLHEENSSSEIPAIVLEQVRADPALLERFLEQRSASTLGTSGASRDPALLKRVLEQRGSPRGLREALLGIDTAREAATDANGVFELDVPGRNATIDLVSAGWIVVGGGREIGRDPEDVALVAAPCVRLAGRIVDEHGRGVPGARLTADVGLDELRALPLRIDNVVWNSQPGATTDAEGQFVLEKVASVPECRIRVSVDTGYVADLPVPESRDEDMRIVVTPPQQREKPLVRGIVLDREGTPVTSAPVAFGQDHARTDERGRFELTISSLSDDTDLVAVQRGFAAAVIKRFGRDVRERSVDLDNVVLRLGGPSSAIRGRILHADGTPAAGWLFALDDCTHWGSSSQTAEELSSSELGASDRRPVTDEDGRFSVGGLRERTYRVRFTQPTSGIVITSEPTPAGTSDLEIRVPPDARRQELSGVVVSRRGQPVAGVELAVTYTLETMKSGETRQSLEPVSTGPDGRFSLRDVPRRGLRLNVRGPGVRTHAISVPDDIDPREARIEISVIARFRIDPSPAERIDAFEVLDASGTVVSVVTHRDGVIISERRVRPDSVGFPNCEVDESAAMLVLYRGETELRRVPIALTSRELTVIRP